MKESLHPIYLDWSTKDPQSVLDLCEGTLAIISLATLSVLCNLPSKVLRLVTEGANQMQPFY